MKRTNLFKKLAANAIAAAAILGWSGDAQAVPVSGFYVEDPSCDPIPSQPLPHELGDIASFPVIQSFSTLIFPTTIYECVVDDLVVNDWEVEIRNTSNIPWTNLFFVGNLGMTIGNRDGVIIDTVNAPGVVADAFRIDGTVTAGVNNPLFFESGVLNEIFEPGESWRFRVTNFADTAGVMPPPLFNSPGLFAGSAPVIAAFPDTASILATPVPEPKAFALIGLVIGGLLMRRPRMARA